MQTIRSEGSGTGGARTLTTRVRAGHAAANISIPMNRTRTRTRIGPGGVEPPPGDYQSPVRPLNFRPSIILGSNFSMGPEGFEPPPPGLKGRYAAVTPRPRLGSIRGRAFESNRLPVHVEPPIERTSRDGRTRTGGLLLPRQADSLFPTSRFEHFFSFRPMRGRVAREGVEPSSSP